MTVVRTLHIYGFAFGTVSGEFLVRMILEDFRMSVWPTMALLWFIATILSEEVTDGKKEAVPVRHVRGQQD